MLTIGIGLGLPWVAAMGGGGATSPLLDGLEAYWKMDEASGNRLDSIGGFTLTPNAVTAAAGKINNAAVLSSAGGSYMSATGPSVGDGSFTVACWFHFTASSGNRYLVSKSGEFALATFSNQLALMIPASGGTVFAVDNINQAANNITYFGCGTYDRSGNLAKIKISASAAVSQAVLGVTSGNSNPLYVGSENTSASIIDGWVDEVGIWSRVLTDIEIDELYNGGAGRNYPF